MLRFRYSHKAILLVYHSINEYIEERIRVPNIVTPTIFEAQIKHMASTASIITLQEYLDHLERGKPLLAKSIIVTFDDGYKDNLTIASPILQKYGVPATFFISTGHIGTDTMKWEDQLSCLIRRSKAEVVSLDLPSRKVSFCIGNEEDKFKAINILVNLLGYLSQSEREQALDQFRKRLKAACDDQAGVMLTWADVRQLADTSGFSIGSHAVTHQHLTRVSPDDAKWEVTSSREHLENEIGRRVTLFSYPYGDFSQDVITAVQKAGYVSAGTIDYGQNSLHSDPFRLKRIQIPNQSGTVFQVGMKLRSSIFGEFLKKSYSFSSSLRKFALTRIPVTRQGEG